jgi:hypothetical protein
MSYRCVELTGLPSDAAFDATLEFLYTEEIRDLDLRGEAGAACLLGMLHNAQYLQIDSLVEACCEVIRQSATVNELDAIIAQPTFGSRIVPAETIRAVLNMTSLTAPYRLKVRRG